MPNLLCFSKPYIFQGYLPITNLTCNRTDQIRGKMIKRHRVVSSPEKHLKISSCPRLSNSSLILGEWISSLFLCLVQCWILVRTNHPILPVWSSEIPPYPPETEGSLAAVGGGCSAPPSLVLRVVQLFTSRFSSSRKDRMTVVSS